MNEEIILNVEQGSPYVVGARAYVTQTEDGAVITIIDKDGTTTATVNNGTGIASCTLNPDYTLTILYTDGTSVTTTPIRGETGASGVYCGDEEPTDPNVNVWVIPNGGDSEDGSVLKLKDEDDWIPIPSIVGEPAGFGTVTATVDANHGTPAVTVTASGDDTAKNFAFAFSNLQPAPYDDSVIQARMDSFTNLAEGSTTGDAELIDGRVGADGVTYANIGGAIRGQITDVKSDLSDETDNLFWFTDTSERTVNGVTLTFVDRSTIKVNGTATSNITLYTRGGTTNTNLNIPAGTYIYSVDLVSGSGTLQKLRFGSNLSVKNPNTALVFDSATSVSFRIPSGTVWDNAVMRVTLSEGSTVKDYVEGGITAKDNVSRAKIDSLEEATESLTINVVGNDFVAFESGTFFANTGATASSSIAIRSKEYIPSGTTYIKTDGNYYFYLLAWNLEGEYVGAWNESLMTFTTSFSTWYTYADISAIDPSSEYNIKIAVKTIDASDIVIENALPNIFAKVNNIDRILGILDNMESSIGKEYDSYDDIVALKSTSIHPSLSEYQKPLVLLHLSDTHNDATCINYVKNFYNKHVDNIDDIICTGDIMGSYYSANAVTKWFETFTEPYSLLTLGNHDWYQDAQLVNMSQSEAYDYYLAPTISNWGAIYTSGKTYWYKDYTNEGIRLIGLDNMLDSSDMAIQVTWLEDVLRDALSNQLSVVTAMHCPPRTTGVKIDSSFTSKQAISAGGGESIAVDINGVGLLSAIDDFIENGGDFVCHMMGHWHDDYILCSSNYPNQTMVVVGTASAQQGPNRIVAGGVDRDSGTKYENLFNIISIDKTDGYFKLLRVGANRDMYMRSRNTLCFDYRNSQVIYSD